MKIISWNCNCAFRNKYTLLPEADILIIPESESPEFLQKHDCILPFVSHIWSGKSTHKGLSVFTRVPWQAKIADFYNEKFKYIIPVEISDGIKTFILWAVWTQSDGNDSYNGYVVIATQAMQYYKKYLNEDSLIIGDFNSNARWNKNFKQEFNHENLVCFMQQRGFYSLYHRRGNHLHGEEKEATIYMYKDLKRPYYIDYAFMHEALLAQATDFKIGEFSQWIKYSDHMPLFIELA